MIQVAVVQRAAVMVWQLNIRIIRFVRASGMELRVFTHGHFVHQTIKFEIFFYFLSHDRFRLPSKAGIRTVSAAQKQPSNGPLNNMLQ